MAYEHEGLAPLPPLREVQRGNGVLVGEADGSASGGAAIRDPGADAVEVGPSSTRKGGSDWHPRPKALREIWVNRAPDVRKGPTATSVLREGVSVKRGVGLVPVLAWVILGLFGLWLYCQIVPLVTFAIGCRGWRMWAAFSLLAVPAALVALVAAYALRIVRRLPSVPQVMDAPGRGFEVKELLLSHYLEKLPEEGVYAVSAGFDDLSRKEVVGILGRLRGRGARCYSDEVGWLDDFREFQRLQRMRAEEIVARSCKLIGLKTAASPWKLVDVICVFLNSTLMVVELARLYNRRVDRGAAFRLVFRWFLNIYISGELGQIGETAAGLVGDRLKGPVRESLSGAGWIDGDWAGTVAQSMPLLAKVAGKVVEGGVNAYFAWRMGRKAIAAFEPLVPA